MGDKRTDSKTPQGRSGSRGGEFHAEAMSCSKSTIRAIVPECGTRIAGVREE